MPTLQDHCKRPLKVFRDISAIPTPLTVQQLKGFMHSQEGASRVPEYDALKFYMMNHAFACLQDKFAPDEPLGDHNHIAEKYFSESCEATARAFYYLLLICTRESRHLKNASVIGPNIAAKHGPEAMKFNDSIRGTGSNIAADKLKSHPPNMPLGRYTASLVDIFNKGNFQISYGGKKWGVVATCLNEFVWGRTTAEMMMDTVWTLCHNNGPIFNKGMLYAGYSHELITILDVQRSGQIPQLIYDCEQGADWISKYNPQIVQLRKTVAELLPEDFTAHVDWQKVETLGSVHTYSSQKNKSKILFPNPEAELLQKAYEAKLAEDKLKQAQDAKENWFFITPTQKLKKLIRVHN